MDVFPEPEGAVMMMILFAGVICKETKKKNPQGLAEDLIRLVQTWIWFCDGKHSFKLYWF